jgi:RNA polymerase sigma factor (sigma-70 family)
MSTLAITEGKAQELWREFGRTREVRVRNVIVLQHLGLVRRLAREAARRTQEPMEDLVQEGCLGLIRAVERFRPERGVRFSSYAFPVIEGALKNYLRRRLVPREEAAEGGEEEGKARRREQPIDPALIEQMRAGPEEDFALTVVERLATEKLLERLGPLEREVIEHFFYADLTQREIAQVVARSSSRVSRILRGALAALREAAREEETAGEGELSGVFDRETGLLGEGQLRRVLERERGGARAEASALAIFRFLRKPSPQGLRRFGEMATENVRVIDQAFRLGEEEVGILFLESAAGAEAACERLRAREQRGTEVRVVGIEEELEDLEVGGLR